MSEGNRPRQIHEWPDASTERLRALWLAGATTMTIGAELGVSRNAVVGKARRLDLPPRPNPKGVPPGGTLPPPRPRSQPVRPPAPLEPPPTRPESSGQCLWPTSDGRPWTFCGARCAPGRVYCAEHVAIAYHTPSRQRFEAAA